MLQIPSRQLSAACLISTRTHQRTTSDFIVQQGNIINFIYSLEIESTSQGAHIMLSSPPPTRLQNPEPFLHPSCHRYVFVDCHGSLLIVSCTHPEGNASIEPRRCVW